MSNLRKGILAMLVLFLGITAGFNAQAQCPNPIVIDSIHTVDPSCNGVCNGTITAWISGGYAPYVYTLVASPNVPVQITSNADSIVFNGLCSSNAVVVVETQDGLCNTSQFGIAVTAPPAITGSMSITNTTCPGGNDGAIDLTPGGGVGGYSFNWSTTAATEDINGLTANSYTVTITDGNSCTSAFTGTVTEPANITAPANITDVSCNGNLDGAIDITPAGGTSPYGYQWSNGPTTEDISGLAAGSYTVTITDASACTGVFTYTVNQPASLALSETHNDESCSGQADGSINLTVVGGTTPYTYSWSNGATTQDISNLGGGLYTVNVTDANGCLASLPVNIAAGGSISLSLTVINSACGANDGSVDVTVSGGSGSYNYNWSHGPTSEDISGLSAGTYTITVTDISNGCVDSITAIVSDVAGPDLSGVTTDASDCSTPDGAIDITVTNGSGSYTFSWSPGGATTEDLTGVPVGTYTVTVVDQVSGCTSIQAFNVDNANPVSVSINITDPDCGINNGAIDITPLGGTPGYTYLWSTGATTEDVSGLGGGVYNVTVTDANNCTAMELITLSENGAPTVTANITNITCPGLTDGAIDITVSGGSGSYSYQWSHGPTTEDVSGLGSGTYIVTIEDLVSGCQTIESYTISLPGPFIQTIDVTHVTCNGDANGAIDIEVTGGSMPYSYLWSPGNEVTEDLTGLSGGTYTVSVSDNNGCVVPSPSVTVNEPSALVLSETHIDDNCSQGTGSIDLSVSGGTAPYTILWSNGANTEDLSGLSAGLYFVTVTDANGCTSGLSVTITSISSLTISYSGINPTCGNNDGSIDINVSNGSGNYSYNWSNGPTTEDISGLGVGTYTVTVTDNTTSCVDSVTVTLTSSNGPDIAGAVTGTDGCTATDGAIDITVSNGSGSYIFAWSHGPATEDVSGLATGVYTVTVTDQVSGCEAAATFSVTNSNPVVISETLNNPNCGATDGSIDLSISGGAPSYTFAWSNGANTEDISALGAGTYAVTVTDANGCTATGLYALSGANAPTLSANITNVSCTNDGNGAIDLTVSGGTSPYTFMWSNGATTEDISLLAGGTYNVVVTDNAGCQAFAVYNVSEPSPLNGNVSITHISCNGNNDGAIDAIYISGGTLPLSFQWSSGPTTEDISGLSAGTYTLTITDANGCVTVTPAFVVTEPAAITINETHTNISCNGANDGTIDITVSGGTSPYTYLWTPGNIVTEDLSNLGPGTYQVVVTDANGCSDSISVTILEPSVLMANVSSTNITCNGTCDGTATATPTGGTTPYTYGWSNGGTTSTISGLCAGTYTVTVTDANGCTAVDSVIITQPTNLSASITNSVNVTCFGLCNGSATVTATGGNSPYTYAWNTVPTQTTQTATNLCSGSYTVTVTDANGCTVASSVTILEPALLVATPTSTPVSCNGVCDGTASVTAVGGNPPYTYLWLPDSQTTIGVTGLCAGTYTVIVTGTLGCDDTATVVVADPGPITANVTSTDVSCNGVCDGTATVTPTGGNSPYTYQWGTVPVQTTPTATNLCFGTYDVTVTDANNCTAVFTANVGDQASIVITTTQTNASCNGVCDGTATLNVTGGVAPYTFLWPSNNTTPTDTGLCAGVYAVTVTDSNGCQATEFVTITEPAPIVGNGTVTNESCGGTCNGSIALASTGGTAPYSYLWSPGNQTTDTITGLCAGTYTVTITDANACTAVETYTITSPPAIVVTGVVTDVTCNGNADGTIDVTVTGGTPGFTYVWAPGNESTEDLSGLSAGTYTITVTDANNCTATSTFTVNEPQPLSITSVITDATCGQCDGVAAVTVQGGTAPFTYLWSNGQTTATASNLCAGVHTLEVTDANGCFQTFNVGVSNAGGPTASVNSTNVSCDNVCDGTASVTASGGSAPYQYLWIPGGMTTSSVTGLCVGTYYVQVQDSLGCITTQSVNITGPAPIVANGDVTPTTCGNCDGVVTINPSGGVGPYTYLWSPGNQTTDTISNLCAGSYSVDITDANNCTETFVFSITNTDGPQLTVTSTDATCNGDCDGTATVQVTGGLTPYSYQWSNGDTTATADTLCPGVYTIEVTDNNGCMSYAQVTIAEPAPISLSFIVEDDPSCAGDCNGTLTVVPSGGTLLYTYQWDDSNTQTTASAGNLCAGSYNVTVTDANGCTATGNGDLTDPTPLDLTVDTVINASCNGVCDGSATVTPTGGTAPYTILWSNNQTGNTATGLCAGSYFAVVQDANGCLDSVNVTITEPAAIVAQITTTNASCNGVCDGTAEIDTVTGGVAPFTFSWNTGSTADSIGGLCAGAYTVTVTDSTGCTAVFNVTITEPAPIVLSFSTTNVTCNGECDGEVTVTPSGGSSPYTYSWNDPSNQTTATADSLCPGQYIVTVTDANGCSSVDTATITEPPALALTDSVIDASCGGTCDGEAYVNVTGGTPGYSYLWNNSATTSGITGLCAGTYTVTVTDANGCSDTLSVVVGEPTPLVVDVTTVNASCGGVCDGEATVSISGGTGPFDILWSTTETTATIDSLCAGTYSVTVTDGNSCVQTVTVIIIEPPLLTASIDDYSEILCSSVCDAYATVTPNGGVPNYTYLWSDPSGQTAPTATGLCAGAYTVTVTDTIGCTATAMINIPDSNALSATVPVFSDVSCSGDCDGSATAMPNGGAGNYTFLWSLGGATSQTITGLCAGTYTVTVTDDNGCQVVASVNINEPPLLTASAAGTPATCGGVCDGIGIVTPSGGTAPYTYLWSDPNSQTDSTATGLCFGTYSVTVTDANGCTAIASTSITEPPVLVATNSVTQPTCTNTNDGAIDLTVSGGTPNYSYSWSPGNANTEDLNSILPGTYTVTVTDAIGCTLTQIINVSPITPINANAGADTAVCEGATIQLNGSGGVLFSWSPGGTLNDSTLASPIASPTSSTTYLLEVVNGVCVDYDTIVITVNPLPTIDAGLDVSILGGNSTVLNATGAGTNGSYSWEPSASLDDGSAQSPTAMPDETTIYYVTGIDENGCTNYDSVIVEIVPGIVFPDGITPNGDNINDTWIIDNIDFFPEAIVQVYNRWGEMLFNSKGYPVPWNGKYEGKDLPVGTYYYVIDLKTEGIDPYTGPITIVR